MKKNNLLMLSSAILLAFAAGSAQAQTPPSYYAFADCGSGLWFSACWAINGPDDGNNVYLNAANPGYTVTYDANTHVSLNSLDVGHNHDGSVALKITDPGAWIYADTIRVGAITAGGGQAIIMQEAGEVGVGLDAVGDSLEIGFSGDESGTYLLTGGTLAASHTTVGHYGSGTFTLDGTLNASVIHQTNELTLGWSNGSLGVYNLGAGRLTSTSQIVGNSGTGEFTQSAPLNSYNNTGSLTVGKNGTGVGTYTMQGGWLFAGSETIGDAGTGTFTHWGGLNDVTGSLTIGNYPQGIGTYSMQGMFGGNPELRAQNEFIGLYGTGSFEQFGGINAVASLLSLGVYGGSSGAYILDGDGALSANLVFVGGSGTGLFTQHSGNHAITGSLTLGYSAGASGTYDLNGGSLSAHTVVVGKDGTGAFNQAGGTNTVTRLDIGDGATSSGSYALNAWGNLNASSVMLGYMGVATFTQNIGMVNVGTSLVIGAGAGSVGTYHLNGGQLNAAHITVGMDGTGVFNQTDGQNRYNYVPGVVASLNVGTGSGSGTYNLSGGSVWKHNINLGTGTGSGTFNHTGGTVSADGTLTIGANGTYNMSAGGSWGWGPDLRAQTAIVNNGTVNFNAGRISAGFDCSYCGEGPFPTEITNNGTFNIGGAGERQLSGVTVNNGTMKITDTTVRFSRDFLNNGAYLSDPSTNIFTSLMVSETGYLVGGAGDSFQIWNDFFNYSTRDDLWNTADATLSFHGWETHEFYLGGWDAASSRSFSWDTLELMGSGDLFFSGDPGVALYVDNLILGNGTTLNLNGFNLYYTTLTDNGGSFSGGQLIQWAGNPGGSAIPAVPEPSMLLLFGSGFAGLFGMRGLRRYLRHETTTS